MNRTELLDKVRNCTPQLGWDDKFPNLYGKYGMTICGICDGWHWFEANNITECSSQQGHLPITDATNEELFEMWATADNYWLNKYKEWLKRSEEKSSKLDSFIGKCESKYFGYDDAYTDKTIDRVFESIFEVLDNSSFTKLGGFMEIDKDGNRVINEDCDNEDVDKQQDVMKIRNISANICSLFEELLDKYDFTIPSDDRTGDPAEARLYGEPYYELEDYVTDFLIGVCEIIKRNPKIIINSEEY